MTKRKVTPVINKQPHAETTSASRAIQRTRQQTDAMTRHTADYPMPIESLNTQSLQLTVGIGNFRTVAVSIGRQQMAQARKNAEAALVAQRQQLAEHTRELSAVGQALMKDYQLMPEATELMAAINRWSSAFYGILLEDPSSQHSDSYNYRSEKTEVPDRTPKIDVAKRLISVEYRFYNYDAHGRLQRDKHIDELEKIVTIPFTPEMVALADQLIADQKAIADAEADLKVINRMTAQVDERADDVESALTVAHLQGQLKSTQDIYGMIRDTMFNNSLLPDRVAKLLPGPEQQAQEPQE